MKTVFLKTVMAFGALALVWHSIYASAQTRFNSREDAAVAMAKEWQAGRKARPMISSDGMVIFPFGQSMPRLTCSPARACDVELEPGETPKKVILADKANWDWTGAESLSKGITVAHVVFQPKDVDVETNVIITTDRRTYHIKLYSPKQEGAYLNRVGFYYPEQLVESWESKMGARATAKAREESSNVLPAPVSLEKIDYDYRIEGDAFFKPLRVVNNGEQVYMEMPEALRTGTYPTFHLIDAEGKVMIVNYRRLEDESTGKIHYVVDRLFDQGELVVDKEKVRIIWKRAKSAKTLWGGLFGGSN